MKHRWLLVLSILLLFTMTGATLAHAAPNTQSSEPCGWWYTVQSGDTWYSLSRATGVSVAALQAANPAHIHPHYWLYVGHRLWIPTCGGTPPPPPPPCGWWYTVRYGDTWSGLSHATGISVAALQAANPAHIHPHYWLYAGHKLWIPCGGGTPPPPPPPPPPACAYTYTVCSGDSWYGIAYATGVSVARLQAANPGLVRPPYYTLYVGEMLCIPPH